MITTPSRNDASLLVVGIGIQWAGQTTGAARTAIERADRVLFAVADGWAADFLRSLNPRAESLEYPRDGRPRASIYRAMSDRILEALARGGNVCAVFYGSPAVMATPAHLALQRAIEGGYAARMLPGVSFLDCLFCDLKVDPAQGCQIFEASDFLRRGVPLIANTHLVLSQIGLVDERGTYDDAAGTRRRAGIKRLASSRPSITTI